jgi:hypothetical protein
MNGDEIYCCRERVKYRVTGTPSPGAKLSQLNTKGFIGMGNMFTLSKQVE